MPAPRRCRPHRPHAVLFRRARRSTASSPRSDHRTAVQPGPRTRSVPRFGDAAWSSPRTTRAAAAGDALMPVPQRSRFAGLPVLEVTAPDGTRRHVIGLRLTATADAGELTHRVQQAERSMRSRHAAWGRAAVVAAARRQPAALPARPGARRAVAPARAVRTTAGRPCEEVLNERFRAAVPGPVLLREDRGRRTSRRGCRRCRSWRTTGRPTTDARRRRPADDLRGRAHGGLRRRGRPRVCRAGPACARCCGRRSRRSS